MRVKGKSDNEGKSMVKGGVYVGLKGCGGVKCDVMEMREEGM